MGLCGRAAAVAGPVDLAQPWALPAAQGADTDVMMTLHNAGDKRDDLLRAACAQAGGTELFGPAHPGGAARHIDGLPLPPGRTVVFAPDGVRLVLHHVAAALHAGQTLHCTATFAHSGERLFEAAVRPNPPPPAPPL
jgi:copper(I)-binding protein